MCVWFTQCESITNQTSHGCSRACEVSVRLCLIFSRQELVWRGTRWLLSHRITAEVLQPGVCVCVCVCVILSLSVKHTHTHTHTHRVFPVYLSSDSSGKCSENTLVKLTNGHTASLASILICVYRANVSSTGCLAPGSGTQWIVSTVAMGAGCHGMGSALTDRRLTRSSEAASTGRPTGWLTHLAVLNLQKQASRPDQTKRDGGEDVPDRALRLIIRMNEFVKFF